MVADRARGEFDAVADDVVLVRLDGERILRLKRLEAPLRHREGIVREDDLPRLRVLLEEREVDDPAELVAALFPDVIRHVVGDVGPHKPRKPVALVHIGRHEEKGVPRFHPREGFHFLELVGGQKLRDGAFQFPLLRPGDVPEALAAVLLDEMLALVEPRAGLDADDALHQEALHEPAARDAGRERLEVRLGEEVGHIDPLERIPQIGLVRAVRHQSVAVLDARPRRFVQVPRRELLERLPDDILDDRENLVLRHIRHFDVELIKLARRAVRARRFVAEARGDLEILVEPGDHQKLLEHLRRLRQGVEHPPMDAARDEVIARALGRGGRQNRRLELVESFRPHLLAQKLDDLAPQNDVLVELLAAQIEEAVLEAHFLRLVRLFVRNVERRHGRGRFHHELVRLDFNFARGEVGIHGVRRPELHFARHGDDRFKMRLFDETEKAPRRMHDDLREAVMVAQIDEQDSAMIAKTEHPAGKFDGLPRVSGAELVASMGAIRMHDR